MYIRILPVCSRTTFLLYIQQPESPTQKITQPLPLQLRFFEHIETYKMPSLTSSATLLLSVLATSVLASPQYGSDTSSSSTSSAQQSTVSGVHSVQVGPGLSFTPDTITANSGEWIEFTFGSGHSVAQSNFDSPCMPMDNDAGVYSGYPDDGEVWRFQVNSTDPIWLYCSKQGHCQGGMSMVINPPSDSEKTLVAYQSASGTAESEDPDNVQGGVFGAATNDSSDSSSSSSSSASSTASSTSSSATASPSTDSGNGASTIIQSGLLVAGAVAAGVAALL
jgi:plastocyanin